ncbi:YbaB/EbfC family nucleoid-associated protein [Actinoplanes sp. NPDC048796]|uniref:YbaB/EbfC family nucleoid-associated protein n=1 Tax=Actinoplanes sp. NPDC048796 TaxID=3155640 RepID=UPI0033FD053E
MFDGESVDGALERIDDWEQSLARRAEQAQALAARASMMSATARSGDGLVEVTVDAEGQIADLHLDEGIRRQSAEATARSIVETLQAAKENLIRQFGTATAETVGADSETGRMLVEALRHRLGSSG